MLAIKQYKDVKEISQVTKYLLLGSYFDAEQRKELIGRKVGGIICAANGLTLHYPKTFAYHRCNMSDNKKTLVLKLFPKAFKFIDK